MLRNVTHVMKKGVIFIFLFFRFTLIQLVMYGMICAYIIMILVYIVTVFLNYSLPDSGYASIVLSTQLRLHDI